MTRCRLRIHSSNANVELPKALRAALPYLVIDKDHLLSMLAVTSSRPEGSDEMEAEPACNLQFYKTIDWEEGVEQYRTPTPMTSEMLCTRLGLPQDAKGQFYIPGLAKTIDTNGIFNATKHPKEFSELPQERRIAVTLRWHQWVGIHKMVTNAFAGKPILLMDDVGIGKTLQVIATVAVLRWYRHHKRDQGRFPGEFGT